MNNKVNGTDFSDYLHSVVKLEELQKMTDALDQEIADSQNTMMEIKSMFHGLPNSFANHEQLPNARPIELARFLEAPTPNLLLQGMSNNLTEVDDLSDIITATKKLALKLKSEHEQILSQISGNKANYTFTDLDLKQYVATLTDLNKRLTNVKILKREQNNQRNSELEAKLMQLSQDVQFFTKMIEAKAAFRECNENWKSEELNNRSNHQYEAIINKLLSDINEVTYLIKNKN